MRPTIDGILAQIKLKITAILRTRIYYCAKVFIGQFKAHIWGLIEAHSATIFHAAFDQLNKLDRAQHRFLDKLGISATEDFKECNFVNRSRRRGPRSLAALQRRSQKGKRDAPADTAPGQAGAHVSVRSSENQQLLIYSLRNLTISPVQRRFQDLG